MPRFPVAFGKRKSTADALENVSLAEHSFRVLDRTEVAGGKSFDGGVRLAVKPQLLPRAPISDAASIEEDNIFADLKTNRGSGSGSSTTIKTSSTENSSRHSNASTAPSSADLGGQEEWRHANKRSYGDIPVPPIPKSNSSGFLKTAGRSWSFGGQKKHLPPLPVAEEPLPESPPLPPPPPPNYDEYGGGRARATTASTTSTATPPKLEEDFQLDLGGDFSKMIMGFDKRGSVATVRDDPHGRQALAPRSLTTSRLNQPSPIQIDRTTNVEASPYSWSSQNSGDQLLNLSSMHSSPTNENAPPQVPRHGSPLAGRPQVPPVSESGLRRSSFFSRQKSAAEHDTEDEDSRLLKESLSNVGKFLSGTAATTAQPSGRYRRNEDTYGSYRQVSAGSAPARTEAKGDEDNIFDSSLAHSSRLAHRYVSRKPSPPRNKVMTPAQFERYRKDKERQGSQEETAKPVADKVEDEEEDNYEDDDDEVEKAKQAAKQRRKQEAHMTVYRQQMTKVTGEANGAGPSRPSMQMSFSTPNLANMGGSASAGTSPPGGGSDGSDDEEVPLAILAAHGFPNKNRPPTRLSTMMSNPNLRAMAGTPSYQRPSSIVGDAPSNGNGGRLPVFARNLPQDPYVGAGLVHSATREGLAFGGGSPAAGSPGGGLPPGGLVGVIANEERSRAMRRGSPAIDGHKAMPMPNMNGGPQTDPMAGIPHQMMYPGMGPPPMLTPGDQAQIQMTQQMQQFMQMQMQFMQMMAAGGATSPGPGQRPLSQMGMGMPNGMDPMGMMGMGMPMGMMGMGAPDAMRHSFVDNGAAVNYSMPRPEHTRSMSMVQPSSASWIQPQLGPGYAPSIRVQGANGYAPSIAPSERSNVGLPGRYRPVSQALPPMPPMPPIGHLQKSSTMSGALGGLGWDQTRKQINKSPLQAPGGVSDDDDEEGWEDMKAKRDRKRSLWRSKKKSTGSSDLGAYAR